VDGTAQSLKGRQYFASLRHRDALIPTHDPNKKNYDRQKNHDPNEPTIPTKNETGRLGPVSEASVEMRLHHKPDAGWLGECAGVVHVRWCFSRQQTSNKERGHRRNGRSNFGASAGFRAMLSIIITR
jgi:hypothetical protein